MKAFSKSSVHHTLVTGGLSLSLLSGLAFGQDRVMRLETPSPVPAPAPAAAPTPSPATSTKGAAKAASNAVKTEAARAVVKVPPQQAVEPVLPPPSKVSLDFFKALDSGNFEIADMLLKSGADINCLNCANRPVLVLAAQGALPLGVIPWALKRGADPSLSVRDSGLTTLSALIDTSYGPAILDSIENYQKVIKAVLSAGAGAGVADANGNTPLHYLAAHAARYDSTFHGGTQRWQELLRLLQSSGGDINARDKIQRTPLMQAVRSRCDARVIRLLISAGADVSARSSAGQSAYDFAMEKAIGGDRECNAVLPVLKTNTSLSTSDPKTTPGSTAGLLSAGATSGGGHALEGIWKGVLHAVTPVRQSTPVEGSIDGLGQLQLRTPIGVVTTGTVQNGTDDRIVMTMRTKVPPNPSQGTAGFETEPFEVRGTHTAGVLRGSYNAPTDSGSFVICRAEVAATVAECQTGPAKNDIARALGAILGIGRALTEK